MIKLRPFKYSAREDGFSLIEVLVTLALFGVLCTVAISNLKVLESPLISASSNLTHFFRLVRVRAIAQTRAIKVTPSSTNYLTASTAANCSETSFTPLPELFLDIGEDVSISDTSWSVCFTQRGLVDDSVSFSMSSATGSKTVEVALGGGIRIQ